MVRIWSQLSTQLGSGISTRVQGRVEGLVYNNNSLGGCLVANLIVLFGRCVSSDILPGRQERSSR